MRFHQLTILILLPASIIASEEQLFSPSMLTNILGAFHGQKSVNLTGLLLAFDLPPCFINCVGDYNTFLTHPEKICEKFTESAQCLKRSACSGSLVDTMNGTLNMMCSTNLESLTSQFDCLQNSTLDLQEECERDCSVQADILDKASKNQGDVLISSENMCKSSMCLVQCYKKNMVTKCSVNNDNLLNKIFASFDKKNSQVDGFDKIMNWVIPEDCKFKNFTNVVNKDKVINGPKTVGNVIEKSKIVAEKTTSNLKNAEKSAEKSANKTTSTTSTTTSTTTTTPEPVTTTTKKYEDDRWAWYPNRVKSRWPSYNSCPTSLNFSFFVKLMILKIFITLL